MRKYAILNIAVLAALLAGCAKEETKDTAAAAKTYFDSWAQVNWPGAEKSGTGIYILEDTPGTGAEIPVDDSPFIFVDYTVTDLEGNVTATSRENIAKRIGSYSPANYYGERVWLVSDTFLGIYAGVEDMIRGMKVGGKRKAAIPYWLCTNDRYSSEQKYLKEVTSGSNLIYEVEIQDYCSDIVEWQIEQLEAYSQAYMGGVDSTHIAGNEELGKLGFYYKTVDKPGVDLTYTMPDDTTLYLNYTGKLLSGKVFDTNIAKVAKDNQIYSATKSYAPVKINRAAKYTDITMGDSSDLIDGFQAAIYMMHPMEKAITAFYSPLGYNYSGSGSVIPPYAPLVFELELVKEP